VLNGANGSRYEDLISKERREEKGEDDIALLTIRKSILTVSYIN
jgi:hypothetical protein